VGDGKFKKNANAFSPFFSFFLSFFKTKKAKKSKADYLKNLLTKARKRNE